MRGKQANKQNALSTKLYLCGQGREGGLKQENKGVLIFMLGKARQAKDGEKERKRAWKTNV